jgi:hypothetical protein
MTISWREKLSAFASEQSAPKTEPIIAFYLSSWQITAFAVRPEGEIKLSQPSININPDELVPFNGGYIARKYLPKKHQSRKKDYSEYLKTGHWLEIRERIIKRCNGICEGCGENKATQVHHLTYKNKGNEFLFELIGLCSDCHNRIHKL